MKKILFADIAAVFVLSLLFFRVFTEKIFSDIQLHSHIVYQINTTQMAYPPHFIYYFILNLFSLFSTDLSSIVSASVILLSLSVVTKYFMNLYLMRSFSSNKNYFGLIFSIGLLLVFAIQDPIGAFVLRYYYFGKTVPNVWHNSTTIFLMPFAILLFWVQYEVLSEKRSPGWRTNSILTLLCITNILIKPSFFIVYAPVTLYMLFVKNKFSKKFLFSSIPVFVTSLLMFGQYILTFLLHIGVSNKSESSIALAKPFETWTFFVPGWYLPISFVHSYAFPIVYLIFYGKEAFKKSVLIKYAVALTVTGLLISIFVKEDGPRFFHGNFMWQNVVCLYILMMSCALEMVKRFYAGGWKDIKFRLTTIVFFWHVASGILYFFVIFLINPA